MNNYLIQLMQALYNSEINCSISCFWDGGWEVKLGDEMNGWRAQKNFDNVDLPNAAQWLVEAARKAYPQSEFVQEWAS